MKRIVVVAAASKDRVIGNQGKLPWHRPADLKHFKRTTVGRTIVMGRTTADGLGKPLPDRTNLVLTTRPDTLPEGFIPVSSVEEAIAYNDRSLYVIGGAQIYAAFLPYATHRIHTLIDGDWEGDTFFPEIVENEWIVSLFQPLTCEEEGLYDAVIHYKRA